MFCGVHVSLYQKRARGGSCVTYVREAPFVAVGEPVEDVLQYLADTRGVDARHARREPRLAHAPALDVEVDAGLACKTR